MRGGRRERGTNLAPGCVRVCSSLFASLLVSEDVHLEGAPVMLSCTWLSSRSAVRLSVHPSVSEWECPVVM